MVTHESISLAIAPGERIAADTAEKVAFVLNKDLYSTKVILASKIPRIVAQYANLNEAESTSQKLESLGFISLIIKDNELRKPLVLFKATALQFGQNEIIFKDKSAQNYTIEPKNVFLIIKGVIQTSREKEVITTVKKLDLPATLLAGGIPIRRNVQKKTTETTSQNEYFLRLFENKSMEFCTEIRQKSFNYSGLGRDMSPSSLQNFNFLAMKIKESSPEAVFYEKLGEFSAEKTLSQGNLDINCKLIYLYQQALEKRGLKMRNTAS